MQHVLHAGLRQRSSTRSSAMIDDPTSVIEQIDSAIPVSNTLE
jgi:hypothetical protein